MNGIGIAFKMGAVPGSWRMHLSPVASGSGKRRILIPGSIGVPSVWICRDRERQIGVYTGTSAGNYCIIDAILDEFN
jgi:hypothetical protein